jgi:hypothetical protein
MKFGDATPRTPVQPAESKMAKQLIKAMVIEKPASTTVATAL